MDFVNRLKIEHLQSFWYFASKINFALIGTFGSLLWATAPSKQEADFYRLRLGEFRWTLTVNSKRARFIGFAVDSLDSSMHMLRNLKEKPSLSPQPVGRLGPGDPSATVAKREDGANAEAVSEDRLMDAPSSPSYETDSREGSLLEGMSEGNSQPEGSSRGRSGSASSGRDRMEE